MADDLITIGSFQFLPEAEAARMHLEEVGIRAFLSDAETVNMDWLLGNAIGYIKVQVPRSQAEEALAVLKGMPAKQRGPEDNNSDDSDAAVCLSCGASLPQGQETCSKCGWSYASADSEALLEKQTREEGEEGSAEIETPSALDKLRAMKRPFFWLLLLPTFIMIAALVLALLMWLASW